MAFITALSKKGFDALRIFVASVLLLFCSVTLAAEIDIASPQLLVVDDGYAVSADVSVDLNSRLEEAVTKGVVLHFLFEFELTRSRWYWFDEKVAARQMTIRLSYHALTRQYRVSIGGLHQSYPTLSEALRVLSRLRNWLVIEKSADKTVVKPGESYLAALHVKLDISQLPKPFQITAVGNRDWTLGSEWKTWQYVLPGEPK